MNVHSTGRGASAAVLAASLVLLMANPAAAQQKSGAGFGLEEVVVTARKREESLQEVPIAITAISAEQLREKSIETPYDVLYHTPSVDMRAGNGSRESVQFFIRGLGGNLGVVTYFSDAPLLASTSPFLEFFDMSSVQVVKGPQGTLFGRSSTGGAVLFQPQRPTNEFEGFVNAQMGNFNAHQFTGAVNIPFIDDKLAVRVAGLSVRRDGFTTSLTTGQKQDDRNRDSVRLTINVTPTDWLESYFLFQDNRIDENATGNILIDWNPNLAQFNPAVTTPIITGLCGQLNPGNPIAAGSCITQRQQRISALAAGLAAEVARVRAGGDDALRKNTTGQINHFENHNQQLINITSLKFQELPVIGDVTFKNIVGTNRRLSNSRTDDLGASPIVNGSRYDNYDLVNFLPVVNDRSSPKTDFFDNFSEEFQIQGVIGGKHNWMLGYYLEENKVDFRLPSLFGIFGNIFSQTLDTPAPSGGITTDSLNIVKGYFGQFTVDLSDWVLDGLRFTGGYRWSESNARSRTFAAVVTPGGVIQGAETTPPHVEDQAPTWNVSFDYQINPALLAYIAHRRGFNPGGINPGLGNANIPGVKLTYDPETVDDLEIGMKYDWELLGRPIRTNVAAYRNWYNDVQRFETLQNPAFPFNTVSQTNNIAKAEITGLEFEGIWNATDQLSLSLNYSWTDAKYTKWPGSTKVQCANLCANEGQLVDLIHSSFVGAAKHHGTIGVRYQIPLGPSIGDLTASADYFRQTEVQTNDQYLQTGSRVGLAGGYGNLNARLDWANMFGQPIDAGIFVRNATDHIQLTNVGSNFTALGTVLGTYSEPRMWGVELRYRFGSQADR